MLENWRDDRAGYSTVERILISTNETITYEQTTAPHKEAIETFRNVNVHRRTAS